MAKLFLVSGTIGCFISVALGAFAAHGLSNHISTELLSTFKTGVQYQFFHSLALILVAIFLKFEPEIKSLIITGWSMILGILLFSGSLYILSLSSLSVVGIVTPFGGIAFLIGWGFFTKAAFQLFEK